MLRGDNHELIEPSTVAQEIATQPQTPVIDIGAQSLPYQSLSPEQFECLLWDLFRSGYERELGHDYTRLMITGADQGRDVWLTCQEQPVGLVQCKRYAGKISRIETLKEIIKFLLYADLNRKLLPEPKKFTFYLSLSNDPSGEVDEFFNTPKSWIKANQSEIEPAAKSVIEKYSSLKRIDLSCAMPLLLERLMALNYKLLRPHELNRALTIHADVRDRHFRIPSSSLTTIGFSRSAVVTQDELAQASRQLACWQNTIENKFIDRPELLQLQQLVASDESGCYLLTGVSGSGKSSLLSRFYESLSVEKYSVLAIKADELDVGINDLTDLAENLKLNGNITNALLGITQSKPLILLIDQMDAVSEVMDQSSNRFRVLVDLILSLKSRFESVKQNDRKPIHIIVSSRPFEASFDTRFTQLEAKHIQLSLPSKESVEALLTDIGIDKASIPTTMYPAIQVPFALSLYVSLITAGESPSKITSKNLLQRWLEKKLTDRTRRAEQLDFLKILAQDMVDHEVLRRPANAYEFEHGFTITALEAAGILVRYEKNIGFSHQAWLDDFQAQSFRCSAEMCAFVYRKQNGLFSRSTILRGLEYLRDHNPIEYQSALDALLFGSQTRRHIKHLLVDILAVDPNPDSSDAERVRRLIDSDPILAKRVFWKLAINWSNWRELLSDSLPELMGLTEHTENVLEWLVAEAHYDEEHIVSLLARLWFEQSFDKQAFQVLLRMVASSEAAMKLVEQLLPKTEAHEFNIDNYVIQLFKQNHSEQALKVLLMWLKSGEVKTAFEQRCYGLDKFVEQYSLELAQTLLPWVVKVIEQAQNQVNSFYSFRYTLGQEFDWKGQSENGNLLGVLCHALTAAAVLHPPELLKLVRPFMAIHIDDVQVMVATALTANGKYFSQEIHDYLQEYDFRMQLGQAFYTGADKVMYSVSGSCTIQLIEEAVAFWTEEQVINIRNAIEKLEAYRSTHSDPADTRHRRIRYSEEYRLTLLARLPAEFLSPRRRRQVSERDRSREPAIGEQARGLDFALVRSPMSAEIMGKAKDRDIVNLINEITDERKCHDAGKRWHSDGLIELSREFGAFAASSPQRAIMLIIGEFKSSPHEHAASEAIENLAKSESVTPSEIKSLIKELNQRGFASKEWIHGVAKALDELARRDQGLEEQDIQLLTSYLNATQDTGHELEADSSEAEPNKALLFGYNNGFRIVPGGNYTIMSAIYHGLLCRQPPDCNAWADTLLQFLQVSKDLETWKCLLLFQAHPLHWADQQKTNTLIKCLFEENIGAFSLPLIARTIWDLADVLEQDLLLKIVKYWLYSDSPALKQVAGELISGLLIIGEASLELQQLWQETFDSRDLSFRRGVIYAACSGWYENGKVRGNSHRKLMACLEDDAGGLAIAFSALFSYHKTMPNDELTHEIIAWLADNSAITAELDTHSLFSCLVKLNFTPKLQSSLLSIAQGLVEAQLANSTKHHFRQSEELVQLAVSLQRGSGQIKEGAMQLYETLLDSGDYQAEKAAEAALRV
ncbi:restriction endonuclease [Shewanella baltica]|uniref:restriction endonuclease n=1 Tax=Shewanella baltica TaxID=62322 RepID=UPI00325C4C58